MDKPILTTERLEASGFNHSGAWVLEHDRIRRTGLIPGCAGVYAFSVDGQVMYVGLAAGNLSKRMYFYQNPGTGQRTNIRLNAVIINTLARSVVAVHFACPPDFKWNGLSVRGAQGLEAGLIATFHLPWNVRGAGSASPSAVVQDMRSGSAAASDISASLADRALQEILRRPRQTEAEIAKALFGRAGYQQKVNPICRHLVKSGKVSRLGLGGPGDPFVYVATPS